MSVFVKKAKEDQAEIEEYETVEEAVDNATDALIDMRADPDFYCRPHEIFAEVKVYEEDTINTRYLHGFITNDPRAADGKDKKKNIRAVVEGEYADQASEHFGKGQGFNELVVDTHDASMGLDGVYNFDEAEE